jgi:predicted  nucleic acid-binding Zn-ribbon protein
VTFRNGDVFKDGTFNCRTRGCPHCGGTQYYWGLGAFDDRMYAAAGPQPDGTEDTKWKCAGDGGCGAFEIVYMAKDEFNAIMKPSIEEILALPKEEQCFRAAIHGYPELAAQLDQQLIERLG